MVDDAVLREVVGADALGTVERTHLRVAHIGGLGGLLLMLHGEQARFQDPQRGGAVLDLRLLILHAHHDASGDVRHAHGGVRGVHGLSAGTGAHEDVDFQVLRIDLDLVVVLVGLGEHDYAGRGGLDAALRFGDGDALHAVHAALVFQARPHTVLRRGRALGANGDLHVLDAAELGGVLGLHGDGPAALLGVPQIHAQQVAGEQRCLLAARTGLDLHDDVPGVIGVARDQRVPQLLLGRRQLGFEPLGLIGEFGVLPRHLARGLKVVAHGRV